MLFASQAFGQTTDDGTIDATANVLTGIEVTPGDDLQFGTLFQDETITLNVDANGDLDASSNAGQGDSDISLVTFTISGSDGLNISLSFSGSAIETGLSGPGDAIPLNFNGTDSGWINLGTSSENFDPESGALDFELGSDPVDVRIGAEITADANQEEGSYSGEITLTADYTDF